MSMATNQLSRKLCGLNFQVNSVLPAGAAAAFEWSLCTAGSPVSVCPSLHHESLGKQHPCFYSHPSEPKRLHRNNKENQISTFTSIFCVLILTGSKDTVWNLIGKFLIFLGFEQVHTAYYQSSVASLYNTIILWLLGQFFISLLLSLRL